MKLVIVQQENGKYLFEVPEKVNIEAGEILALDTARGRQTGWAICDAFEVQESVASKIMSAFGTQKERMKKVIGKVVYELFEGEQ